MAPNEDEQQAQGLPLREPFIIGSKGSKRFKRVQIVDIGYFSVLKCKQGGICGGTNRRQVGSAISCRCQASLFL